MKDFSLPLPTHHRQHLHATTQQAQLLFFICLPCIDKEEEFHPSSPLFSSTFIDNTRSQRPWWYSLPCLRAGRLYPHGPVGSCRQHKSPKNSSAWSASVNNARCGCVHREVSQSQMGIILVAKKQLCKDRNCQQTTMVLRPLVRLASITGLHIFCSRIGDFGHPVGRHGRGGNGATPHKGERSRGKQNTRLGVLFTDTFLGDPCTQVSLPSRRRV